MMSRDLERGKVENEKLVGHVSELEKQQSMLKEGNVDVKERLNRAILNKEVLEQVCMEEVIEVTGYVYSLNLDKNSWNVIDLTFF